MNRYILLFILITLCSCGKAVSQDQEPQPTLTQIQNSPAAIPTSAPTPSPELQASASSSPQPTSTEDPTTTATPSPMATATEPPPSLTPTLNIYDLKPDLMHSGETFREPSPDEVMWFKLMSNQVRRDAPDTLYSLTNIALGESDWASYVKDLNWLSQDAYQLFQRGDWNYEDLIWPMIQETLLSMDEINLRHLGNNTYREIKLEQVKLHIKKMQLDHDPEWEMLIYVYFKDSDNFLDGIIPVDIDDAGNHSIIPNDIMSFERVVGFTFYEGFNLLGDELDELIIVRTTDGIEATATIYEATDGGIWLAWEFSLPEHRGLLLGEFNIADFDGDGLFDLRQTQEKGLNPECRYEVGKIVSYANQEPITSTINTIGDSVECRIATAIRTYPFDKASLDADIEIIEQGLEEILSKYPEESSYLAWVRVLLATKYELRGQSKRADEQMDRVIALSPANPYAAYLKPYWDKSEDYYDFCLAINQQIEFFHRDDTFPDEFRLYVDRGMRDITNRVLSRFLCDVDALIIDRVNNIAESAELSPEAVLAQNDLSILNGQSMNLDADEELEWLGYIGPENRQLFIILNQVNGLWRGHYLEELAWHDLVVSGKLAYSGEDLTVHVLSSVIEGNKIDTLVNLYVPYKDSDGKNCGYNGLLWLDGISLEELDFRTASSACVDASQQPKPIDLATVTADNIRLDRWGSFNEPNLNDQEVIDPEILIGRLLSQMIYNEITAQQVLELESWMETGRVVWTDKIRLVYAHALTKIGRIDDAAAQYRRLAQLPSHELVRTWAALHLE